MTRQEQDKTVLEILQEGSDAGKDFIRGLLEHTIQRVLQEEMAAFLNAESYERTKDRRGYRSGYKPRTLKTRVGRLELMVPRDREGKFQTELFEKYQRSEKALMLAVYQLPESHRRRMRSTNMLERFNQKIKRRTRVVRIFPSEISCIRLISALAIEMNEEWMERRYLTMDRQKIDLNKMAEGKAA